MALITAGIKASSGLATKQFLLRCYMALIAAGVDAICENVAERIVTRLVDVVVKLQEL